MTRLGLPTSLFLRLAEKFGKVYERSGSIQIAVIDGRSVDPEYGEDVTPLPVRDLVALTVPVEFAEDLARWM